MDRAFVQIHLVICSSDLRCCKAMLDWNDLRYVLAVARAGGLARAAEALGVNHSTMFRRLNALEGQLGVKLFERLAGRYLPTEAGERLIGAAERIEAEALAADREISGRDARLAGRLRVTASETLAYRLLTKEIARFRAAQPGIEIELLIDNRALDLSRREADVALRATRPAEGDLFGRKLADMAWAVYGSPAYLKVHGAPNDAAALAGHALIGWGLTAAPPVAAADWLGRHLPESAVVFRSSSLINQLVAARAGIGLALLPCYLADPEPEIVRVLPPIPELVLELWMITHNGLKNTARVRAFMELVGEGLRRRFQEMSVA
jgi:DNA-binding transcriptional LysR family regulator